MVMPLGLDNERVQAAIAGAERRTSAEIVIAVTDVSEDYRLYPLLWSMFAGAVVVGAVAVFWPDTHVRMAFVAAGFTAFAVWLLLHFTALGLATVPAAVKNRAARGLAHFEFAERVAGRTAKSNGLLIFMSLGERHIEIVADAGLAKAVPETSWAAVVAGMTENLRTGRITDGAVAGIEACVPILAAVFPPEAGHRNELDDAVVAAKRF